MRIRWRDFEIPSSVTCDQDTRTDEYGKFIIEPFERGFGVTVGNSLRRILLSSLEGAAVTSVKIEGVQHEFSTLTGVYEDVTNIILNLKSLRLKIDTASDAVLEIFKDKKGDVTAADIQAPEGVEVLDPDFHIATLTQDIPFRVELRATKGRGYLTAEENSKGDNEIGLIWVDSSFSPVTRVRYKTEDTRVGQLTNYDRLIMEIWTDGTIQPELALVEAAKILRKHLNPFIQYTDIGFRRSEGTALSAPEEIPVQVDEGPSQEEIQKKFGLNISALGLSVRAYNCLEAENIQTVGDLVARTEDDMLKVRNFGKTSLDEIREKLTDLGLKLGMPVPAMPGVGIPGIAPQPAPAPHPAAAPAPGPAPTGAGPTPAPENGQPGPGPGPGINPN